LEHFCPFLLPSHPGTENLLPAARSQGLLFSDHPVPFLIRTLHSRDAGAWLSWTLHPTLLSKGGAGTLGLVFLISASWCVCVCVCVSRRPQSPSPKKTLSASLGSLAPQRSLVISEENFLLVALWEHPCILDMGPGQRCVSTGSLLIHFLVILSAWCAGCAVQMVCVSSQPRAVAVSASRLASRDPLLTTDLHTTGWPSWSSREGAWNLVASVGIPERQRLTPRW
jgi:hypothetical protein